MRLEDAKAFIYKGDLLRVITKLPDSNPMDIVTTTAPEKDITYQRFSYKFLKTKGAIAVTQETHPEEFL